MTLAPRSSNLGHQRNLNTRVNRHCDGYSFVLVGNEGFVENPRAFQSTRMVARSSGGRY